MALERVKDLDFLPRLELPEDTSVILHIGRHKSGTSSIQRFFNENRQALHESGYYYPTSMAKPVAHHGLALGCNYRFIGRSSPHERAVIQADFKHLTEELARCSSRNIIFSSEQFQNCNPLDIRTVVPNVVKIIVYLREQLAYLQSSYSQAIQNQKITTCFDEYTEKYECYYDDFLDDWSEAFPDAELIVRIFDRSELVAGDVVRDLVQQIGIDESRLQYDQDLISANPSIHGKLLEFKRIMNVVSYEEILDRRRFYKILDRIARKYSDINAKSDIPIYLSTRIRDKYKLSNDLVCRKYFPGRQVLFDIRPNLSMATSANPEVNVHDICVLMDEVTDDYIGTRLHQLYIDSLSAKR